MTFVQGMLCDLIDAQILTDPQRCLARLDKTHYLEMIADGFTCSLPELNAMSNRIARGWRGQTTH